MDTTAQRLVKQARDTLVDGLGLYRIVPVNASPEEVARSAGYGLNPDQHEEIIDITNRLFRLLDDDPAPPECQNCATPLTQTSTGRPRRYCSAACRQADYRARNGYELDDDALVDQG
jgi:hypothetical protein